MADATTTLREPLLPQTLIVSLINALENAAVSDVTALGSRWNKLNVLTPSFVYLSIILSFYWKDHFDQSTLAFYYLCSTRGGVSIDLSEVVKEDLIVLLLMLTSSSPELLSLLPPLTLVNDACNSA